MKSRKISAITNILSLHSLIWNIFCNECLMFFLLPGQSNVTIYKYIAYLRVEHLIFNYDMWQSAFSHIERIWPQHAVLKKSLSYEHIVPVIIPYTIVRILSVNLWFLNIEETHRIISSCFLLSKDLLAGSFFVSSYVNWFHLVLTQWTSLFYKLIMSWHKRQMLEILIYIIR